MIKVDGHHGLFKNHSGAVVSTDMKAYERAKERKREKNRLSELEERVQMMEKILERLANGNEKTK